MVDVLLYAAPPTQPRVVPLYRGIGYPNPGTQVTNASSANTTVAFPAVTHSDGYLIFFITFNGTFTNAQPVATPAGWTFLGEVGLTGNTALPTIYAFGKAATGSEGGTNLTFNGHGVLPVTGIIVEFSGVDQTNPIDAFTLTSQETAGQSSSSLWITPVTPGVTLIYGTGDNTAAHTATQPAGWVELADGSGSTANMEVATIGGQSPNYYTWSITWSGSGKQVGIALALKPASTTTFANINDVILYRAYTPGVDVYLGPTNGQGSDILLGQAKTITAPAIPPSIVWNGVASLVGAAIVADTPVTQVSSVSSTGAATLTALVTQAPKISITAASTLTAPVTQNASCTITAASTLTSPVTQSCIASLTAGASLSSLVTQSVLAPITGAGTLAGLVTQDPLISMGGLSTVTVPVTEVPAIPTISAASILSSLVTEGVIESSAGAGSLTALVTQAPKISITAAGTLTALVTKAPLISITAAATLTSPVIQACIVSCTGAGVLTASATVSGGVINGVAAITAAATLNSLVTQACTSSSAGAAALSVAVNQLAQSSPSGASTLTARVTQDITASLTALGVLNANAVETFLESASITGAGVLTATPTLLVATFGVANIAGAATLVVNTLQYNFRLWDGVTEIPLILEGEWNGSTVIPLVFETVTQ